MRTSELPIRHLALAQTFLTDAREGELSLDSRLTAAWNAGLQVAMARLTKDGRRPRKSEWEGVAESRLVDATGDVGRRLTVWAADRYNNPFSATSEAIAEAVAAVESFAHECAST